MPDFREPEGLPPLDPLPGPLDQTPGLPSAGLNELPEFVPVMDDLLIASQFVELLKGASLDNVQEIGSSELAEQIRHASEEPLTLDDPDERLSIDLYLAVTSASEATYNPLPELLLSADILIVVS